MSRDGEPVADATAQWLAAQGGAHGVRIPSVAERGRAMGMLPYLTQLGLDELQLFSAQGNSFDRAIVGLRLGSTIASWLAGNEVLEHRFPTADQIMAVYRRVYRDRLEAGWHPPMENPVPAAARIGGAPRRIHLAAEDGRQDQ